MSPEKPGSLPDFRSLTVSEQSLRTPSYGVHRPTGQAVVTLCGRDLCLGKFGPRESRAEYDRIITELLVNGRTLPPRRSPGPGPTSRIASCPTTYQISPCHAKSLS